MNFFDNMQSPPNQMPPMANPMMNNDIYYKINDLENKIKKLEQRVIRLESDKSNVSYNEPDTSLYMI